MTIKLASTYNQVCRRRRPSEDRKHKLQIDTYDGRFICFKCVFCKERFAYSKRSHFFVPYTFRSGHANQIVLNFDFVNNDHVFAESARLVRKSINSRRLNF